MRPVITPKRGVIMGQLWGQIFTKLETETNPFRVLLLMSSSLQYVRHLGSHGLKYYSYRDKVHRFCPVITPVDYMTPHTQARKFNFQNFGPEWDHCLYCTFYLKSNKAMNEKKWWLNSENKCLLTPREATQTSRVWS